MSAKAQSDGSASSESGLLSSLSHPNVIKFYEDYIDDEMLHIVSLNMT